MKPAGSAAPMRVVYSKDEKILSSVNPLKKNRRRIRFRDRIGRRALARARLTYNV